MIFFNEWARGCAYFIGREEEYNWGISNKSLGIIDAKSFAPAAQMAASALIFSINLVVDVSCRLKTLLFRSFQTSQLISMVRLRTAFFGTSAIVLMFSH